MRASHCTPSRVRRRRAGLGLGSRTMYVHVTRESVGRAHVSGSGSRRRQCMIDANGTAHSGCQWQWRSGRQSSMITVVTGTIFPSELFSYYESVQ